ncbi:unnamed protein product [Phytophthora fragariaefolia]|uniref:Unnamed protein product n=1 Tax=Phytophthora fragariaefolia TaxID=1490495 RepID=A0A9W6YFP7_9STRA|nr:unnamed protein product [Phytophthora fragariaefolia]
MTPSKVKTASKNVRPKRSRCSKSRKVVEESKDVGGDEASQQSDHSEAVRDRAETKKPQRDAESAESEETPVLLEPDPANPTTAEGLQRPLQQGMRRI